MPERFLVPEPSFRALLTLAIFSLWLIPDGGVATIARDDTPSAIASSSLVRATLGSIVLVPISSHIQLRSRGKAADRSLGGRPQSTQGRAHRAASGRSTAHANPQGEGCRSSRPAPKDHWPRNRRVMFQRGRGGPGGRRCSYRAILRGNQVRLRLPPQAAPTEGPQELGRAAWINRAPAVQPYLDELAWSAAGLPQVIVELIGATEPARVCGSKRRWTRTAISWASESLSGNWPRCHPASPPHLASLTRRTILRTPRTPPDTYATLMLPAFASRHAL